MSERIAQYCEIHLNLQDAELSEEYYYGSLPFCIIDAVYSLAARYSSTRKSVIRFCNIQGLQRLRPKDSLYPDISEQYPVRQFGELLSRYNDYQRITIALSKKSVEFFKSEAAKHHTQYQRMIRKLVDAYVDTYENPPASRSPRTARKRAAG